MLAVALPAAVAAIAVAGCGGSPSPTTSTTGQLKNGVSGAYQFSTCMRQHGVTDFPDPRVTQRAGGTSVVAIGVPADDAGTPTFKAAQKACQGILPAPESSAQQALQEHRQAQVLLAFTQCLRGHGVPKFPDPDSQGHLSLQAVEAAGVDLHAPVVLTAARACVGVTHGAITMAQVEQAINGAH
jgi:hypothetical protein